MEQIPDDKPYFLECPLSVIESYLSPNNTQSALHISPLIPEPIKFVPSIIHHHNSAHMAVIIPTLQDRYSRHVVATLVKNFHELEDHNLNTMHIVTDEQPDNEPYDMARWKYWLFTNTQHTISQSYQRLHPTHHIEEYIQAKLEKINFICLHIPGQAPETENHGCVFICIMQRAIELKQPLRATDERTIMDNIISDMKIASKKTVH